MTPFGSYFICGSVLALLLCGAPSGVLAQTSCAATAAGAVRVFEARDEGREVGLADGYRVASSRQDAVLGVAWITLERCGHPERPKVVVASSLTAMSSTVRTTNDVAAKASEAQVKLAVRNGDTVRAWKRDANVRLQMAAVSDQSGAVGERIKLHLAGRAESSDGPRYMFGLVRGPADVEIE